MKKAFFLAPAISLIAFALSAARAEAQAADSHSWARYGNARFQYSICYPKDVLTAEPEAENGDGRSFSAKDGASLAVWGNNNALSSSLKQEADDTAQRLAGSTGRVTYRAARANWAVVSGESPSGLFYSKIFFDRKQDQFKQFEITYAKASAELYKPIVEKIAGCFADLH